MRFYKENPGNPRVFFHKTDYLAVAGAIPAHQNGASAKAA